MVFEHAIYRDTKGTSQTTNNTYQDYGGWDTEETEGNEQQITRQINNTEFQILVSGHYLISYNIASELTTGSNRANSRYRWLKDTTGEYSPQQEGQAAGYFRIANNPRAFGSCTFITELSAGDPAKYQYSFDAWG